MEQRGRVLFRSTRQTYGWYAVAANMLILLGNSFSAGQTSSTTAEVQNLLKTARSMLADGRLAESEILLRKAYESSPSNIEVLSLLGRVEGSLGDPSEAMTLFRKEIELAPEIVDSHLDLAIALSDSGRFSESLIETSKALSLDPNSAKAHLTRARNLADIQLPDKARQEFAIACRLAPTDPQPLLSWALLEEGQQNFAKETLLLEQALKLQPDDEKALVQLAKSLLNESRNSEAITVLQRAIALDPVSAEATYMLSRVLSTVSPQQSRDLQKRFAALKQNNSNLDHARVLGNESYAASTRHDWAEAIRLLRQAVVECGSCDIQSKLHLDLGLALYRSGNLEDGAKEFRVSLSIDPKSRDAAKALSVVSQLR